MSDRYNIEISSMEGKREVVHRFYSNSFDSRYEIDAFIEEYLADKRPLTVKSITKAWDEQFGDYSSWAPFMYADGLTIIYVNEDGIKRIDWYPKETQV